MRTNESIANWNHSRAVDLGKPVPAMQVAAMIRDGDILANLLHKENSPQGSPMRTNEALSALLSLVRREAPHLSGKVVGDAEAALASAPPAAEPAEAFLTDEEISDAIEWQFSQTGEWPEGDIEVARVIERAVLAKLATQCAPQPAEPAQPATHAGAVPESLPNRKAPPFDASQCGPKNPTAKEALEALGWLYWHRRSDAYTEYSVVQAFISNAAQPTEQPSQDAERLDWLEKQAQHTHTGDGGYGSRLRLSWSSGVPGLRPMKLRQHIDAARAHGEKGSA